MSNETDVGGAASNSEWGFYYTSAQQLKFVYYDASSTYKSAVSTSAIPTPPNAGLWFRAIVNSTTSALTYTINGTTTTFASGTTTFFTSLDGANWTQLGSAVSSGTAGFKQNGSSAPGLSVGSNGTYHSYLVGMKIYKLLVQRKLTTTASRVANPDWTQGTAAPVPDTAATPNSWALYQGTIV